VHLEEVQLIFFIIQIQIMISVAMETSQFKMVGYTYDIGVLSCFSYKNVFCKQEHTYETRTLM